MRHEYFVLLYIKLLRKKVLKFISKIKITIELMKKKKQLRELKHNKMTVSLKCMTLFKLFSYF